MSALAALLASVVPAVASAAPFVVEELPARDGRPAILLAPRAGTTATLAIRFATGSVDDGDGRSGLTRVAQHALLAANGAVDLEGLTVALHAAGARLSVWTGLRECAFVLTATARDFPSLASALARGVLAPRLDRRRFRIAVERALHDVREPGRGSDLAVHLASLIVEDLRYRNEPFGDREQIELLEPEDVEAVLGARLSAANATIVVAGAFERGAIAPALRAIRGGTRAGSQAAAAVPAPLTARSPTDQPISIVAVPFAPRTPRDAAATRVLVALLEDELWRTLRGPGVAYTFAVAPLRSSWLDLLLVVVPAPASPGDVRAALDRALEDVRLGQFDGASFARARSAALARLRGADGEPEALAAELLAGGPGWHGPEVETALADLARGPFQQAVGPWLAADARIAVDLLPPPPPKAVRR